MPSELENFQSNLLESVKQMKLGQAARTTQVKFPEAAEACARMGMSQQAVQ